MPTRSHHSILYLEAFTIDTPDIQRALIRRIRGQRIIPACPDSVTFSEIKSWPSGVALHGRQESTMIEEQYEISNAVKQILD